jgi:hypothetical protein
MAGASASKMPEFAGDDVEDAPEFDNYSWDGWTPVGWVRFFFSGLAIDAFRFNHSYSFIVSACFGQIGGLQLLCWGITWI